MSRTLSDAKAAKTILLDKFAKAKMSDNYAKAEMNYWYPQVRRDGECAKANYRSLVSDADSNEQRRTPYLQYCL